MQGIAAVTESMRDNRCMRERVKWMVQAFDFIIIDLLCVQFFHMYWHDSSSWIDGPYEVELYRNMALMINCRFDSYLYARTIYKGCPKEGYYSEFMSVLKADDIY